MKKEDIKQAYEGVDFSENLQDRYFKNITSRKIERRKFRKTRLSPALLVFLLIGTTVYAAERLDFLEWYFGGNVSLISSRTDKREYSAENGHLKIAVESTVWAEQYAAVFIHIQALDEEGKRFMEVNSRSVRMRLAREFRGKESEMAGWAERCLLQEDILDEENWYYVLKQVYHDSVKPQSYDEAVVYFPAEEQRQEGWIPEGIEPMELHLPIAQAAGTEYVYTKCGEIQKVSVSPLAVNVEWKSMGRKTDGGIWPETLEIAMKDGRTLKYAEGILGEKICDEDTWDFAYTSGNYGESGEMTMSLVLAKPLDVEQIASVRVNGVVCEP